MTSKEPILAAEQTITVGIPVAIEAMSLDDSRGVMFEDDGETGYFYARDFSAPGQPIVDALQIYLVESVIDRDIPSEIHILWSFDYNQAVLIINQCPHAVFDFGLKCGYSRDHFPGSDPTTGWKNKPWEDSLREHFFK